MPAVGLSDLLLERKTIADGDVEAQVRMTLYTVAKGAPGRAGPGTAPAGAGRPTSPHDPAANTASDRVVAPVHAAALFAQHSWVVLRTVALPPPAPPPPPPEPTAPPLPYRLVGSFAPQGEAPVYFLAQGDRVIDVRVGDRLDGVYQLESAAAGQLVFLYLPLNIRQGLSAGASK